MDPGDEWDKLARQLGLSRDILVEEVCDAKLWMAEAMNKGAEADEWEESPVERAQGQAKACGTAGSWRAHRRSSRPPPSPT